MAKSKRGSTSGGGLTAKQRKKLPIGLQKAIAAKKRRSKKS